MSASLPFVDATLFTALLALQHSGTPSDAQPFARVVRGWAPIDATLLQLGAEVNPTLIFVWGRTKPVASVVDPILATAVPIESRSPDAWTVYVVLEETRSPDDAIQGAAGAPAILALVDTVLGTLHGLPIAGTYQDQPAMVTEYGPQASLSQRGTVYVAEITVSVLRTTPHVVTVSPPVGAVPLEQISGTHGPSGDAFDHSTILFP